MFKYNKGDDNISENERYEKLIEENKGLIYKLANKLSSKNFEDLYQVGVIGLITAYNNFDSSYNVKFSTYAYPFILGEMKKYIRDNVGIKISREVHYLSSRLDKLIDLLSQKYKRMPTVKELSIETNIEEWKIIEALNIKNCIKSIDTPINEDLTIKDVIAYENTDFSYLLEDLNEEEKEIIESRYLYGKSQSEIAKNTGYSQAKVSRIENKILTKIKEEYKAA